MPRERVKALEIPVDRSTFGSAAKAAASTHSR
jgi:hypothetical protein